MGQWGKVCSGLVQLDAHVVSWRGMYALLHTVGLAWWLPVWIAQGQLPLRLCLVGWILAAIGIDGPGAGVAPKVIHFPPIVEVGQGPSNGPLKTELKLLT